jgi:hypothetical protein
MNGGLSREESSRFTYAIYFQIFYETKHGQEIWVHGSIPELGSWRAQKVKLFWTEGHIWVNKEPLLVNHEYFEYKYALYGIDDELEAWEEGVNRIADLKTMPSQRSTSN